MRVLVVDDEPIMRDAYTSLIEWEENGFSLVGSVHNGKVALEFMRENPVDIVITDLKMPVMSGLELIKNASAEFPEIRFIVMSGFDEFHLVKEAYNLGVKEYFLKIELDPQAILQTLFKIREEIQTSRLHIDSQAEMSDGTAIDKHTRMVHCEKLLKNLIWGADAKATEKQLNEHEIYLQEHNLFIMVLSIPDYYTAEEKLWKGEREIFKYAILNVLEEICRKYNNLYVFYNLPNEFPIVCNIDDKQTETLRKFFDDVRLAMNMCFGLEIDCGLSSVCHNYTDLKTIYREARDACAYSFVSGHGKLIDYKDIQYLGEDIDVARRVQEIKKLLTNAESDKIRNGAFKLRVSSTDVGFDKVEKIKNLFYSYYIEMVNFVEENGLESDIAANVSAYDSIKDKADLSEMNDWLVKSLFDIADAIVYRSGIYKAVNYIKNHYSEQISLNTLAELLEMSEGHLSRMFQKKVGMNFTQYLMKVRMDMAVQLLQNQNLKIYEVAMRVGYPNAEQFSRMFKKVMGKSPKEFQK